MLSPVTLRPGETVRINHVFAAALLCLSGLCALVFQTVWLKEFRLVFGGSTPASAAVLAIFMGGLGLGNAVLGPRVDRLRNPLLLYSILELGVALAAAASPYLTDLVRLVYTSLGGQETLTVYGATLLRLLLSALVLGIPTFLMGGTMPAMARAVTGAEDESRGDIGLIYGLNTLGAVLGAALSTFVLLEQFGGRATLWMACALNLALALAAYVAARSRDSSPLSELWRAAAQEPPPSQPRASSQAVAEQAAASRRLPGWTYLLAAGVIGGAFFLMELVWFRMLGPILGGSTFTFGAILAVALAGIGLGAAIYPLLYRHRKPTLADFALTCLLEALAIAAPYALGDRLALVSLVLADLSLFGFSGQVLAWCVLAAIVVFPAALASGVQFPVLIALIGQADRDVGRQLGAAFACNTFGAMLGSLAGGFGLLPLLSAPGCWIAVTLLLVGLGAAALVLELRGGGGRARLAAPLLAGVLALTALTAQGPTAAWRHAGIGAGRASASLSGLNDSQEFLANARRGVTWEREGRESSVALVSKNGHAFIVNGKSDGNAMTDAPTQIMLGALGALLHPHPRTGLVIGLGTGESAGWMAAAGTIEQVDVVELEPAIKHVAEVCAPVNNQALASPKVRLIDNDARELLLTTRERYDLIVSEPSNPYRAGVASLFTREFYDSARQRLNPGGVFLQWMQAYEIDAHTVRCILGTLQRAFGYVEIWETKTGDAVLVCSAQPIPYTPAQLRQRLQDPGLRQAVLWGWQCDDLEGVAAHFVADERLARKVHDRFGAINTDDANVLEYGFARSVGRRDGMEAEPLVRQAIKLGYRALPGLQPGDPFDHSRLARSGLLFGVLHREPIAAASAAAAADSRALAYLALWAKFQQGDYAGAARDWQALGRAPDILPEKALVAELLARVGDPAAEPLTTELEAVDPAYAAALRGEWRIRAGRREEGAKNLHAAAARFRKAYSPFAFRLDLLLGVVLSDLARDRRGAPLYRGLFDEPFVVHAFDGQRKEARVALAQCLSDKELVAAFAEFEPYPLWRHDFLRERRDAYARLQHSLAPAAARDYDQFLANQTGSELLPGEAQ